METAALHFHCSEDLGAMLPLHAGDDAVNAMWLDIDESNPKYATLYASHRDMVNKAADDLTVRLNTINLPSPARRFSGVL